MKFELWSVEIFRKIGHLKETRDTRIEIIKEMREICVIIFKSRGMELKTSWGENFEHVSGSWSKKSVWRKRRKCEGTKGKCSREENTNREKEDGKSLLEISIRGCGNTCSGKSFGNAKPKPNL